MTIDEAKELKHCQYVTDGKKLYLLHIYDSNPHDYWFWRCNKRTGRIIEQPRSECRRVYTGSKNVAPYGLDFLETVSTQKNF